VRISNPECSPLESIAETPSDIRSRGYSTVVCNESQNGLKSPSHPVAVARLATLSKPFCSVEVSNKPDSSVQKADGAARFRWLDRAFAAMNYWFPRPFARGMRIVDGIQIRIHLCVHGCQQPRTLIIPNSHTIAMRMSSVENSGSSVQVQAAEYLSTP